MHAREILKDRGLRPKKHFGQNFLMDRRVAARIAALCVLDDLPVVEVGPGTGALTAALLDCGLRPRLVEIDADMIATLALDPRFAELTVHHADALAFEYGAHFAGPYVACGNLPYNIGTPLVLNWVEDPAGPVRIVAMLQKDVVDRLIARPGSEAYGAISALARMTTDVRRAFVLGADAFYPRPRIQSAVAVFERLPEPRVPRELLAGTREVVRAAFAYRRKTLLNSLMLATGRPRPAIEAAIATARLAPTVRGEECDVPDFAALARAFAEADAA